MQIPSPILDRQIETIAELRELYRASEARASRLRLLSVSGRAMAEAGCEQMEDVLQNVGAQLAYFIGRSRAQISFDPHAEGIAIPAPGHEGRVVGRVNIQGLSSPDEIAESEDRDTFQMQLEMMGATIDRVYRERERTALLNALREREQRLEYLVGRIFSAQEDERRCVSQDLHDGVAQTATALARMLEGGSSTPDADLPARERAVLAAVARDLVAELRAVIAGLRPTILDDLGLKAAIHSLGDALAGEGFDVSVRVELDNIDWPANTETALFRVAQEGVANIRKHASDGCRVEIDLSMAAGNVLHLHIEDFGVSCASQPMDGDEDLVGTHVGIDVMRERMAALGGKFGWEKKREGGVIVTAQCGGNF